MERINGMNNMVKNGDVMVRTSTIFAQLKKYNEALNEAETMEDMMTYTKKITILEGMLNELGYSEEEIFASLN